MHKNAVKTMRKGVNPALIKAQQDYFDASNTAAKHMTYIMAIALYDKMEMTWKKLDNCYNRLYSIDCQWRDDNNKTITTETLTIYSKNKGIDVLGFVRGLDRSDKMNLAGKHKKHINAAGAVDAGIMITVLMIIPILKTSYRYSNKKINEFLEWVAYVIKMYNTKLPKEPGTVFSDEYIRQIFIEEQGFDMKTAQYIKEQ